MNRQCPGCRLSGSSVVRNGCYFRQSDSRHIQRFRCNACGKHFSSATFSACYRQKKRRVNHRLHALLSSTLSQRRLALLLRVSRTTIARKLTFLAAQARTRHKHTLVECMGREGQFEAVQFDDLETIEHTKCKPVTVTVVVDPSTRFIIDYAVARIPAKGHLAAISRKKYGKRKDESRQSRQQLFERLKSTVSAKAVFESDEHNHYPVLMRAHFPAAVHRQYKSIRGCVTGQGELKKTQHDPLFSVNHTLAMLRANINRLVRRTWCTTKELRCLDDHLAIYQDFHNRVLLTRGRTTNRTGV